MSTMRGDVLMKNKSLNYSHGNIVALFIWLGRNREIVGAIYVLDARFQPFSMFRI
jgi:hypothetical protein